MAAMKATEAAPKVGIRIPPTEAEDALLGAKQYEHVTINGKTTMIEKGVFVEVSPEVFEVLKIKYPSL